MMKRSLIRKCGSCSACCYVLSVGEGVIISETDVSFDDELKALHQNGVPFQILSSFHKPKYQKCQHQKIGSRCCGIYTTRPEACKTYTCAWLDGMGSKSDRPDESGIVFTHENTLLGPTLLGLEVIAGRATRQNPVVQQALRMAEKANLGLIIGGKTKRTILRIPPGMEMKVVAALQAADAAGLDLGQG